MGGYVDSDPSFPTSPPRLPPAHQSLGMWTNAVPQPSAAIDYVTRQAVNIWGKEPAWQNPLLSSTPILHHASSLLKMCLELGNLKEGLIKGSGKHTVRRAVGSSPICCSQPSESSGHPFSFLTPLTYYDKETTHQAKESKFTQAEGGSLLENDAVVLGRSTATESLRTYGITEPVRKR